MTKTNKQTKPLSWWTAGILLGLVQVLAVSLSQSLDVSKNFVTSNIKILESASPEYIESHPLAQNETHTKSDDGWWLVIGIFIGACIAAIYLGKWKIRTTSDLWQQNHKTPIVVRIIACFFGGFLILIGAGISYGGISKNFIAGLSELSFSAIPFTAAMFLSGMFIAYFVFPVVSVNNNNGK